jgi:MFS transporter, DHA1 family, tetracycline resistance protein
MRKPSRLGKYSSCGMFLSSNCVSTSELTFLCPSLVPLKSSRQAAIWFILISVLLDVLSFGVLIPILPNLIKEFTGGNEKNASFYVGLFGTIWAVMHFFCAPILGVLSDQFGRRKILLLSCFGLGLDYILMGLAPNLTWLLIGRIISGITAASFATAGAYIADVTVPEKRAAAFGMFGAAFGVGFVIGPALGGYLGGIDLRLPFWVAAALTLVNACYGLFVLPESLSEANRRPFSWARANPIGSLRLFMSQPGLLGLAFIYFLYQLAHQVLNNVFVLYTEHRYHWEPWAVGRALAIVGVLNIIVQGGLVRPALKKLGETKLLYAGLVFGMIGYACYGLAYQSWMFWLATPIFSLMAFFTPSIQGLMSKRLGPTVQGQLQGANGSLSGIAGMIGPGLFSSLFAVGITTNNTATVPGLPFLVASGCLVVGLLVAVRTLSRNSTAAD